MEETWRIMKFLCSHQKGEQIFLSPPVCLAYTYSPIAQSEDFLCAWRIKLPKQAFVLKVELYQNIQTEGGECKST